MERAQSEQIDATLLQRHKLLDHIGYLCGIEDLLYRGMFNHGSKIIIRHKGAKVQRHKGVRHQASGIGRQVPGFMFQVFWKFIRVNPWKSVYPVSFVFSWLIFKNTKTNLASYHIIARSLLVGDEAIANNQTKSNIESPDRGF